MKKFFQNLSLRMQRFMAGRYGPDELYRFLVGACLVCLLLSCIEVLSFLLPVALVLMLWAWFRCYSKDLTKRQQERETYLRFTEKLKSRRALRQRKRRERKTHRFYTCPNCKTSLRVPKGKGKIRITCPNCQTEIVKKT